MPSRRDFVLTAAGGTLAAALGVPARAAPRAGYSATVGVFLYGGNDGWNMVIPTDARHAAYRAARGGIAIEAEALAALTGSPFALHPAMAALRPLWDEGALSLVLDAGPRAEPGGHWDAQRLWGPSCAAGAACDGPDAHFADPATGAPLVSGLARRLKRVARTIASRGRDAAPERFVVGQGGYDTHAGQAAAHAALLGDLAAALAGFHRAMRAAGLAERVTAHTMSDFGRAWRGNAQGGTDHGWATNHLVIGDALAPRRIHGAYPVPGRDSAPGIAQDQYLAAVADAAAGPRSFAARLALA